MTVKFLNPVQDRLEDVENHMRAQGKGGHPDLAAALNQLISAGGKRIRPTVTLLMGQMFQAPEARVLDLAAAVELLHTATLVHDDLIDGALLRRGMSTINADWSPAATVLTGDFIFARAAKLAAATKSVAVMDMFAETLTTIVNGEINQYFVSKGLASRDDYYKRIHAKTASLFELASGASALLRDYDEDTRESARRFGYEIGMAFQIADDILDFTGQPNAVGKPLASDLRIGLITLPAICYHEANPTDPDMLSVIARNGHSRAQIDRLVDNIRESDAINQAVEEARQYVQRAINTLNELPERPERQVLTDLAAYIIDRDF